MSTAAITGLAHELAGIVRADHVEEAVPREFWVEEAQPALMVSPGTEEEVAAVLRVAAERRLTVVPAGGFTSQHIGALPEHIDILLRLDRLKGIEHYDPGDLTIGIRAGTTLDELAAEVGPHGQMVPLDPCLAERRTVGGVLATAAQGPLRHAFGSARDFCLGVRFVTAEGKIAKAGGRVVKNVAGYDVTKLMIGSYGTLGVIVAANFKLFPAPRQMKTFVCPFGSLEGAIAFRDCIRTLPLTPMCLEVVSPLAANYVVNGMQTSAWTILLRAAGSPAVLARYRKELGTAVSIEAEGNAEAELWRAVSDFEDMLVRRHANAMGIAVHLPIASVEAALQAAETVGLEHNLLCAAVGRIGVGALVLGFAPLAVDPPSAMQYAEATSALRAMLPEGSSAVVTRCPHEAKLHFDVWGAPATDIDAMRAIRRAMDPERMFNRGRFVV